MFLLQPELVVQGGCWFKVFDIYGPTEQNSEPLQQGHIRLETLQIKCSKLTKKNVQTG